VTVTGAGGVGLPNRQVKFEVVTGAFAIESNDPATPLVSTLTVVSDQFGVAQVIIQATPGAPTQPALLRATELTTGNQQTAQFTIVQTINGSTVLSIVPSDVTINGPFTDSCSTGFRIDYYIYGGTPPYSVVSTAPGSASLVNSTVLASGLPFTVITNGACVDPLVFSIRDSAGLQTTATLHNVLGTTAPPTAPTPTTMQVLPGGFSGVTCGAGPTFPEVILGGTPPYNIFSTPALGPNTIVPQVVKTSGGTFVLQNLPANSSTVFTVVDSSGPQQGITFTITCGP
jgi:hypothetical protein